MKAVYIFLKENQTQLRKKIQLI